MIGKSAGKSFAYLLGVYLGDGCVTRNGRGKPIFRLNTIDEDFALATKEALNVTSPGWAVTVCKHSVAKSSKPNYSLSCNDPEICEWLTQLTDKKRKIPVLNLLLNDKPIRKSFISGLMDSEGFVAANRNPTNRRYYMGYKSCDKWVPDFIRILESVGVKIGKISQEEPLKEGYKTPTRFTIKMQSWIDSGCYFNIKRKQDRVNKWASFGPYEKRARNPRRLTSETNTPDTEG
jgi:hypothetical protein